MSQDTYSSVVSKWFTPIQMLELDSCTKCQECIPVCPMVQAGYPDGAMERIHSWHQLSPGIPILSRFLRKNHDHQGTVEKIGSSLTRCTTCGLCAVVCESGIATTGLWESMRGACRGMGYSDASQDTRTGILHRKKNPYNEEPDQRISWIPQGTNIAETADIALFIGCTIAYRDNELRKAAFRILSSTGTRVCILGNEEYCCGSFLFRVGASQEYADTILTMIQKIQAKGVKEVLVPCAGCLKTLTLDWPRIYGAPLPFLVTPFPVFMREMIRKKKIRFVSDLPDHVAFHDPCHAGRHLYHHLGQDLVFEAPRDVLSAIPGIQIREFSQNRQYQSCCGAGGGVKTCDPQMAGTIAGKKLTLAEEMGVHTIVSTCPFCKRNFTDAVAPENDQMKVMDLIELVDSRMIHG